MLRSADTTLPRDLDLRAEGHAHAGLPPGVLARAFSVADPDVRAQRDLLRSRLPHPDPEWDARFDATEVLEALVLDLPDAPDLGHLQAAWAWARSWCRAGALAVVDNRASAFRTAAQVLAVPADDPSLACFYRIWVDEEHRGARGPATLLYTAGMGKFGRAELVCFVDPAARERAEHVMHAVARGFILGAVLVPGDTVVVSGVEVLVDAYAAGFNAPVVELAGEGQGLLLVLRTMP